MTFPNTTHQGFVHRGAPSLYPATEHEEQQQLDHILPDIEECSFHILSNHVLQVI